ncbi:TPA: hypothetical protein ACI6CU_004830, partial [Escherichia coli]
HHVVTNVIKVWSVEAISGLRPEPRQRFTGREKIPCPVKRFLNEKIYRFDSLTVQVLMKLTSVICETASK